MIIRLPEARRTEGIPVEEALNRRKSCRDFMSRPLTLGQLSQILWSAQGSSSRGSFYRTAPSAGATYPLDIFCCVGKVEGIQQGVFIYAPREHVIALHLEGDKRRELAEAALWQDFIREAPLSIIVAATLERIIARYGERGRRYTFIEVGHVGQNIYLMAESLGLGTVAVGAFYDEKVAQVLNLPEEMIPIYIMPIGYRYEFLR